MEPIRQSVIVDLEDETQVAVARRGVHELCQRLGLGVEATGRAETISVELANNILQHAVRGQMLLGSAPSGDGVQIVAIDGGPGIASVARAFDDGYSTKFTPGLGLGGVRRMAQEFSVFSELGKGVVASACVTERQLPHARVSFPTAVLSTAIAGETVNGDSWAMRRLPGRDVYMVVDGLGHGLHASEAAYLLTTLFLQAVEHDPFLPLAEIVQQMHAPMRATRGAAVLMVAIDKARLKATSCGVGNIGCVLAAPDGSARSLVSHNGTVGHQMRRVQEFDYPIAPASVLLLHSDGLMTHWKLASYGGLMDCSAATIAGVLYRDAVRGRDDATIMVSRLAEEGGAHG